MIFQFFLIYCVAHALLQVKKNFATADASSTNASAEQLRLRKVTNNIGESGVPDSLNFYFLTCLCGSP
jgi:hypothetical protein